jgi:hypothetical protein
VIGHSLRISLWLASALALGIYLAGAGPQVFAPTGSHPVETAVLERASRMVSSAPIVADPGTAASLPLMPGFPFVVSGFVYTTGEVQPWQPRLATLLLVLLTATLIAVVVYCETESLTLGAASAGLVLTAQGLFVESQLGAGPEIQMLLLSLGGFACLRWGNAFVGPLTAAIAFAAACFTHPAGLWFAFAAVFHLAVHNPRRLAFYGASLVLLVGGGNLWLSETMGPWFSFLAWDVLIHSVRFDPVGLLSYFGSYLLGTFGVLTLSIVLAFSLPIQPWRGAVGIWTWMMAAALFAGAGATQARIGDAEALRFVLIALIIAGTISIRRVTQHLSTWPGSNRLGGKGVVLTALVLQFVTLLARNFSAIRG